MHFALSADQLLLQQTVRDLFTEKADRDELRAYVDARAPHSPDLWRLLTAELGLVGIAVPERFGGAGGSLGDLTVVLEESGRALLCAPFFATAVLAVTAVRQSRDDEAQNRYLPGLISGTSIGTLAHVDVPGAQTEAVEVSGGWSLTGAKQHVIDGSVADLLIVSATTKAGPALFAVQDDDSHVTRSAAISLDPTRRLATLRFDGVAATLLGTVENGRDALDRTLQVAQVCLAAEQVGGAQRCLDLTVRHTLDRRLHGRPLAMHQAVKHRCADMYVGIELARAAGWYAAWAVDEDTADKATAIASAAAVASDAFYRCATGYMQLSGGIGYTWEHDAHLYLERAVSSRAMFASPEELHERIADAALGM
ncbi:acyl-CoA dehydrogenase family protein [Rhodococcus sp. CSLK01-03]|uniref:Acyl-CoA dehydrogenase family protein n=1 Tax=Rhodococcus indonesiensis TaxID=3055869 RepID=A0ABT7RPZ5_9NOCA|nr:acyl-CoA dehydrogenase family protein [Rhodococcus indonesiensis]MDM7489344.1 acyl-CoA dehydrogenase family protein [Rhodococcus indonesiensis]